MESLFRQTDLEVRVSLNMNVLDGAQVPRVMDLRAVLQAFLDHRHEVLIRRTSFRLRKIEQRLEAPRGYLLAYLTPDEEIVRASCRERVGQYVSHAAVYDALKKQKK